MTPFGLATVEGSGDRMLAAVRDGRVHPLESLLADAPGEMAALFPCWDEWVERIGRALDDRAAAGLDDRAAAGLDEGAVRYLAPVPAPPSVFCIGANYRDHSLEMSSVRPYDNADAPYYFLVPSSALTGHRSAVRKPSDVSMLDWEVELAVVIGREAKDVTPEDALNHVAGYTVANDVSVRDPEIFRDRMLGLRWFAAKGADTFLPLGPSLVPRRFVPDPMRLDIRMDVNGEPRQRSNTSQMVVDVQAQIAYLSSITTLRPGDLVLTGTPAGTGSAHGQFLQSGDVMTASIENIGALQNDVVDAAIAPASGSAPSLRGVL